MALTKLATHMCLGGKYFKQKSVPSLCMRCHCAAIQGTTTTYNLLSSALYCSWFHEFSNSEYLFHESNSGMGLTNRTFF